MGFFYLIFHLGIICACISVGVAPPPGHGGEGNGRGGVRSEGHWRDDRPQLDNDAINHLKNTWANCRGSNGRCQENQARQKRNRNAIKAGLMRDRHGGQKKGLDDATVERRFKKAYDIKKTMMQIQGLSEVEPHDNGFLGGDMLFNEDHLDKIASSLKGVVDSTATGDIPLVDPDQVQFIPLTGTNSRLKRADVLALDYYGGDKWPSNTIHFYIDPKQFTKAEGDVIRNALKSITQQVPCLTFVEGMANNVIEFVKTPADTDDGTCGWSDVGYQSDGNTISINFASSICKNTLQGVCVHEILHALGFVHEHTRYDRDKYLKIDWTNVDPGSLDVFKKDDPHVNNPYCVAFDPLSIMHYDPYVGAVNSSKPVMTPVTSPSFYLPLMGQGKTMTAIDANLLNKMYCKASSCKDKSVNCGWTACGDDNCKIYGPVCPKSCNKC